MRREVGFVYRFLSLLTCISLIAILASCGSKASGGAGAGMAGMPPAPVRAVAAVESDVPLEVSAIGNVEATSTVDVKARVAGQILRVHFQDGQDVRQGEVLFEIDPEALTRQITELKADVAKDVALERQSQANIAKDEATVKQAKAQADRGLALAKDGIYSKEQTEQVVSTSDSAQASLEADRAAMESAQASLAADRAKLAETDLQLSYTKVVAPISGRAGPINAKQGTLVKDNDTVLVTLLQVSPIYVSFGVPEQLLPEVRKYNGEHALHVNAVTSDGINQEGQLRFIDSSVDATTGTIKLKAQFENQKRALWPGQFVNVNARLNVEHDRILVPSMTVQTGPQGKYVWVMDPANSTVAMRPIQVLRSYTGNAGEQAVIGSGLRSGEMVISEGQMRLMPGGKVVLLKPNTQTGSENSRDSGLTPAGA